MADRLKKTHNAAAVYLKNTHNRHGSVDDKPPADVNDSRVEEMLPTVMNNQQQRQNTKSVQMRSTMYNNSYFQKLLNNVQNKPNQDNSQPSSNLNIVDMKKKQKQNHNNSADISPMHVIAQNNQ